MSDELREQLINDYLNKTLSKGRQINNQTTFHIHFTPFKQQKQHNQTKMFQNSKRWWC